TAASSPLALHDALPILGNGVNLAVFSTGRLDGRAAAFVTEAGAPALAANPLPQALVLTAIVIGFALFVFALAVLKRSWEEHDKRSEEHTSELQSRENLV